MTRPSAVSYHRLWVCFACLGLFVGCAATPAPPALPGAETPDLASALEAASNANTAVVAFNQPAPCCDHQTLPQFLGIRGACQGVLGIVDRIRNRLGMVYPGLEAKPPLLAITDPANMSEDAPPAVKAAAEIKAQEDAAAQKIKALRYLATIGCGGCYPDVEEAFLAALDDCTEEVRYEAILAIRETTGTNCCYCAQGACCSEKIQNKLHKIAYDKAGGCCAGEPSARVRRQARMALAQCGPPRVSETPEEEEGVEAPTEGPGEDAPTDGEAEELPPAEEAEEEGDEVKTVQAGASPEPTIAHLTMPNNARTVAHLAALLPNERFVATSVGPQPRALPPVFTP